MGDLETEPLNRKGALKAENHVLCALVKSIVPNGLYNHGTKWIQLRTHQSLNRTRRAYIKPRNNLAWGIKDSRMEEEKLHSGKVQHGESEPRMESTLGAGGLGQAGTSGMRVTSTQRSGWWWKPTAYRGIDQMSKYNKDKGLLLVDSYKMVREKPEWFPAMLGWKYRYHYELIVFNIYVNKYIWKYVHEYTFMYTCI